jgi:Raf kinase inhibitor-like YbhB/YbcL family protein
MKSLAFCCIVSLILAAGCAKSPSASEKSVTAGVPMSIQVTSPAFENDGPIPKKYTADGENVSPELDLAGVSSQAKELALIVDDPDAPSKTPWVHWVLYKIPPQTPVIPEGSHGSTLEGPSGAVQGTNSWNTLGYRGPEPPRGHGVHHYHFKVYALSTPLVLALAPGATKDELLAAMKDHVMAQGELVGTYQR